MEIKLIQTQFIPLSKLEVNKGQVEGIPSNPRRLDDDAFAKLKKSIEERPGMLALRELCVYPHGKKFVVLGGNMRLRAMRELKYKEAPCKVIPEDTPLDELKAFVVVDNSSFGAWDYDALANEWDDLPLQDWGVPAWKEEEGDVDLSPKEKTQTELLSGIEYNGVYYEPDEVPQLELRDCINTDKFDAKIAALDEYDLTPEQKETLRLFAYRFLRIDFEAVANYYAFNATDEERKAIERLRLVLSDNGLNGFIEDKLLRVAKIAEDAAREE